MNIQKYYKQLALEHEQSHYRAPELQDPIYQRELACIDVAKNATVAAQGNLRPTFAPQPSFFDRLFGHFKDHHVVYRVPTIKTIYWLWEKYRPTPWIAADNQRVIETWLGILYGEDLSRTVSVADILRNINSNDSDAYRNAKRANIRISIKERWQQVVEHITDTLPPYG